MIEIVSRSGAVETSQVRPIAPIDPRAEFDQILAKARRTEGTPQERAREASEQLVAHALVLPILKEFRENNNAAPPFAPNRAERSFRSLMDVSLAQRMVKTTNWPLVDRLAQNLLKKFGPEAHPHATPTPTPPRTEHQ